MSDLTSAQTTRLRRRIGDTGSSPAMDDTVLQDAYDEADSDLDAATVILLEWLLADSVKLHDYRAGQTSQSLSQVRKNLEGQLQYWRNVVGAGGAVTMVGLKAVPTRKKESPS